MSEEFILPDLPYAYNALEPYYSEQMLRLHHDKHHAGYVNGLNMALKKLKEARDTGDYSLIKHWEREMAFHGAGHWFHSLFWENMHPGKEDNKPGRGELFDAILRSFGSYEKFLAQFKAATIAVEGSGWGVLAKDPEGNLHIFAVENHQKVWVPGLAPLLVCDVWEHAYYLQYQNRRPEWVDNFIKLINWKDVEKRYKKK
ncbi:superoxide dismutase [Candidatus Woesearchaeota archaeon]|nr:superoxide dismutase [Candidatus Woesearchaeota archaeon]